MGGICPSRGTREVMLKFKMEVEEAAEDKGKELKEVIPKKDIRLLVVCRLRLQVGE